MKNFNLETEVQSINAQAEREINAANLKAEVLKVVDISPDNVIIYAHSKNLSVGFGWREAVSKEDVKSIFKAFPINGNNYELKFASDSKNFFSDSPLVVKWENSHTYHHAKQFKIQYQSGDIEIQITVPVTHFAAHIWYRSFQGKHKSFGRYETYQDVFIDYFYTQSYSGGYNTLYFLEGAETLAEYENFVMTGEFKYSNEIETN